MITLEKLEIFERFYGDNDHWARSNKDNLFEKGEWESINSFYQDIQMINNAPVADAYIAQVIHNIEIQCDNDTFNLIILKIGFYEDFQKVANILKQIRSYISPETDTIWAGFANADEFLKDLDRDIFDIVGCDFLTLSTVNVKFMPTCRYQEMSISNGWGDEYIKLANEFDGLYKRLMRCKIKVDDALPKPSKKWWHRLLDI